MESLTLNYAIGIDLCTIVLCVVLALRCASSLMHPAVMMIGCHIYVVTVRLFQLLRGMHPMEYTFIWKVQESELLRASVASDLALLAMATAWVLVMLRARSHTPRDPRILLSPGRIRAFAIGAFLLGLVGTLLAGPNGTAGAATDPSLGNSGYIGATTGWFGWSGCLLIYLYGFRPRLVALTGALLALAMMLNTYRGVVIIPVLFLLWTWLARRQSKGFPFVVLPILLAVWLAWLPMKPIAHSLQTGSSIVESVRGGSEVAFSNFAQENGSAIDFQFLDMIGATMTLVDIHDSYFYGTTVLPILVSPIPRGFWPDKPEVNDYQFKLDIPSRPLAKYTMTAGLVGESYANFGWFGIVLVPFLISLAFCSAYSRLQGTTLLSPGCLLYLIYLSTFMQLYRDGLLSAVWFPFVHCAPMGLLAISHWVWHPRYQTSGMLLPSEELKPFDLASA